MKSKPKKKFSEYSKQIEDEHQQKDLEFKSSIIDHAKRGAAIDKLKIEYFDKETGSKKTENIYLTDNEYLLMKNNKKNKDDLEKFKGQGKFYKYDDLISYIEILRRYDNDKKTMKHSLKKAKDFVKNFDNETGKNIKVRTFNSFLDKIDKDYSEISNSFFEGKTNIEILLILKMKLHFNVKV